MKLYYKVLQRSLLSKQQLLFSLEKILEGYYRVTLGKFMSKEKKYPFWETKNRNILKHPKIYSYSKLYYLLLLLTLLPSPTSPRMQLCVLGWQKLGAGKNFILSLSGDVRNIIFRSLHFHHTSVDNYLGKRKVINTVCLNFYDFGLA